MSSLQETIAETLNNTISGCNAVAKMTTVGDSSVSIDAKYILEVANALKTSATHEFHVLQAITGTDYPVTGEIEITYILASFSKNLELLLKVRVPRGDNNNLPKVNSVVSVWSAANFQERECYDMLGVEFVGHPDPRRILTSDGWIGHPLRKDYVVQEVFEGMVVNPPAKINTEDQFFGKKLRESVENPKSVSWSWKDPADKVSADAKEGE